MRASPRQDMTAIEECTSRLLELAEKEAFAVVPQTWLKMTGGLANISTESLNQYLRADLPPLRPRA